MKRRTLLVSLTFALASAACGSRGEIAMAPPVDANEPYHLGPGDKVRITVFGQPTLTGEYTVTGAGDIAFPLVGNVPVTDSTVEQLQDALRARLAAGYFEDPKVSAEIIDYRPYYVLGEVNSPGKYPYAIGLTIDQAVATSGGYTYRANTNMVYVKRALSTKEWLVDLRKDRSFQVRPGDTIRVAERFF